jgi:hypothetical protein
MSVRPLALAASLSLVAFASPALAGELGCTNCYRKVVTPPVYGTVAKPVLLSPARTVAHAVPGEYGTVAETVMVSPPRKVWQVTVDKYGHKIGCWVTVPAQYATHHRTVMVRPPTVVHHHKPALYGVDHHTVMVAPPRAAWVPTHARPYARPSVEPHVRPAYRPVAKYPAPVHKGYDEY